MPSPKLLALPLFLLLVSMTSASAAQQPESAHPAGDVPTAAAPVSRASLIRAALDVNPGVRAAKRSVQAMQRMSEAEGSLPAPEVELQVWQVPIERPYAIDDAQMIMVGLMQRFPAPGALSAMSRARTHEARAEEAMVLERARMVAREVGHAFADYLQAYEMRRIRNSQLEAASRVVAVATARYVAGEPLVMSTQAEVEVAMLRAQIEESEAQIDAARASINALLLRPVDSPLGPPEAGTLPDQLPSTDRLVERAKSTRPEVRAARSRQAARAADLDAARSEQTWPMFGLGVSYFAPTNDMPMHGYGVSATMSLPWLWGGERSRTAVQRERMLAAGLEAEDAASRINVEVNMALGEVRTAMRKLKVLRERVLPATKRAYEAGAAGYESGTTDILNVLMAQSSFVGVEAEIVEARAMLEHALTDLDWAAGSITNTQQPTR